MLVLMSVTGGGWKFGKNTVVERGGQDDYNHKTCDDDSHV